MLINSHNAERELIVLLHENSKQVSLVQLVALVPLVIMPICFFCRLNCTSSAMTPIVQVGIATRWHKSQPAAVYDRRHVLHIGHLFIHSLSLQ